MQTIRRVILFPIAIVLLIVVIPMFFEINLPMQIWNEIQATIKELKEPDNPTYRKFENKEWGISFEYPSHLELAGGEDENGQRYAALLYDYDREVSVVDLDSEQTELFGVTLAKNRTFDQEVERVGGSRIDLVEETQFQGYRAKEINEHVNAITGANEQAFVVDYGEFIATFYLSYKNNIHLSSYYQRLLNTFEFK